MNEVGGGGGGGSNSKDHTLDHGLMFPRKQLR